MSAGQFRHPELYRHPEQPPPGSEVARVLRWIGLGAALFVVLWLLGEVLLLVFAAVLIAVVLGSASRFVARRTGLGRRFALGLLLFLLFALIGYAAFTGASGIINQTNILSTHLQDEFESLRAALSSTAWGREVISRVERYFAELQIAGVAQGIATRTISLVVTAVLLIGSAIYFALAPNLYVDGAVRLLPQTWRPRGRATLIAMGETLGWWFLGQLIDMATIGAMIFIGLMVLGVPLSGELATIATLFNFVPYVGAICGAAPAVLVALGHSPGLAIEVVCLFLAVQFFEGNIVAPLVQRRTVELPPVLTIFSQTVFGTLFGPLGLIMATPIAAVLMVGVRIVYIEGVLGDRPEPVVPPE